MIIDGHIRHYVGLICSHLCDWLEPRTIVHPSMGKLALSTLASTVTPFNGTRLAFDYEGDTCNAISAFLHDAKITLNSQY